MSETKLPESISEADILEFVDRVRPKIYPPYKHLNPFDSDLALEIIKQLQTALAEAKEDDSEGTTPLAVLEQIVRLQAELEAEAMEHLRIQQNTEDVFVGRIEQLQNKLAHVSDLETLYRKGWDAAAGNVVLLQAELDKLRWIPVDADKDNKLNIGQYIWAYNPKFNPSTFTTVYTGDELDINYTHWMLATPPSENKDD